MNQGVEYIDMGDHYCVKVDGSMIVCISCKKPIEFSKKTRLRNHHCKPSHENRRMGAHRAGYIKHGLREPLFGQKLEDGFNAMKGETDD